MTTVLSPEVDIEEPNNLTTIRVAKLITIRAETESLVAVVASKPYLITMKRNQTAKLTQRIVPTRTIHEVQTSVPFPLLLTYFSKKHFLLHKHMFIASGGGPPECIVRPEKKQRIKTDSGDNHRTLQLHKASEDTQRPSFEN